jgi:DNA repair photolyase
LHGLGAYARPRSPVIQFIIPGLNDHDVVRVLEAAYEAGARRAGYTVVRLPGPVLPVFEERIRAAFPLKANKILNRTSDVRGGDAMTDGRFGHRMRGQGTYWDSIERLLETTCRRLGMRTGTVEVLVPEERRRFARPAVAVRPAPIGSQQLDFFRSLETREPP